MKFNAGVPMEDEALDTVVGGMGVETQRMAAQAKGKCEQPNRYYHPQKGFVCEEIPGSTLGNTVRVKITDVSNVVQPDSNIYVGKELTVHLSELTCIPADMAL